MTMLAVVTSAANAQTLIAGWDFQTTTTGGTAAAAAPGSPLVYNANFGSGTLFLNGTSGSSVWTSLASNPQVTSFAGTTVNAGTGFSTTTSGAASLALANSSANGNAIVFSFDMTGYEDLTITYATQGTATGFNLQTWAYSTDAVNWTNFDSTAFGGATTFAGNGVVTLDTVTGLDNSATAYVRVTFTGASAAAGNNRLDNIQFNAVPEPASVAMIVLGLTGAMVFRRRRVTV